MRRAILMMLMFVLANVGVPDPWPPEQPKGMNGPLPPKEFGNT